MLKVGTSKQDITAYELGYGMMGYGMHFQTVKGVKDNLSVRAVVFEQGENVFAFVNAEICFYTIVLKQRVIQILKQEAPEGRWNDSNVMLTAQHTHSGPGGMSQHLLYNLSIPGFRKNIFEQVAQGTALSILEAANSVQEAKLYWAKGSFDPDVPVAFNRSLEAYNKNPEVKPLEEEDWHLAVDREMKLLRIDKLDGTPMAAINWFGVHTTSISNDNQLISFDNKGYASQFMEEQMGEDFVAIFAQDTAGDVTPNYVWDSEKKWTRGIYKDDFKSARYNGRLQFDQAIKLFDQAQNEELDTAEVIDVELMYVDMSCVRVNPEYANGQNNQSTGPATHGVAFLIGTNEGPGAPEALGAGLRSLSRGVKTYEQTVVYALSSKEVKEKIKHKYETHGVKDIVIEAGAGRLMGTSNIKELVAGGLDPSIRNFKLADRLGYTKRLPWIPQILPFQIAILGPIAIVGLPSEITTIAGKRLRQTMADILAAKGVQEVMLSTYANAYHGYVTTFEEYQCQKYEGGHTVFGHWTLAAYQSRFAELAKAMLESSDKRSFDKETQPPFFAEEEIWNGDS